LLALLGLVLLSAGLRSLAITRPLLGNFAAKNVMYGMIARNWDEGRAGILYPTLDCMVGGQRSLHMLELPVSAYVTGALWRLFGGSLDVWGRVTAVALSAGSVAILFFFVRRRHSMSAAIGAALALALSPVSIIYGQSFMLDASLVFFTLATFDAMDRWLGGGRRAWLVVGALSFALLLLTKVYMLVLVLPLGLMVFGLGYAPAGQEARTRRRSRTASVGLIAGALAVVPTFLWSIHAIRTAAPEGPLAKHVYSSLQGNAESYRPPDPLLKDPDFYRKMLDDLMGVMLTPVGFALLLAGFLNRSWRSYAPWLAAMVILVLALPRKFYEMDYYDAALLPPLCVMIGLGWQVVWERIKPGWLAGVGLLAVCLVLSLRYAYKPAFVTPEEDRGVVSAGRAIQRLTDPVEPVATMHGTTIDLIYYSDRPGWNIEPDTPDLQAALRHCAAQGARYLAVAGPEAQGTAPAPVERLSTVERGDGYRVLSLSAGDR
jgi:4-amino-4-deoxy-L-arabinose transferase-like glycosyltransferase